MEKFVEPPPPSTSGNQVPISEGSSLIYSIMIDNVISGKSEHTRIHKSKSFFRVRKFPFWFISGQAHPYRLYIRNDEEVKFAAHSKYLVR